LNVIIFTFDIPLSAVFYARDGLEIRYLHCKRFSV